MDAQTTVFVVDDDESVGRALGRILQAEGFSAQTWTSAGAFLAEHDPNLPGCLITDLIMPDMSGLELQRELSVNGRIRPIIFITARGDVTTTVMGMRAGAVSFLPKPVQRSELIAAVHEAVFNDIATRLQRAEKRHLLDKLRSLTPRERQVLELVVKGLLNKQIAAQLGAAEKTIKVHRGRLMHKMNVRSAAALVTLLGRTETENGWVPSRAARPSIPMHM